MKFIINSAGDLSEIEKRVYKRSKWLPLCKTSYGDVIYEIEIESLHDILEMCVDYDRGFSGILIQEISYSSRKNMEEAGAYTDAKFEITCYNSWIE